MLSSIIAKVARLSLIALFAIGAAQPAQAEETDVPRVVVSLPPVHALVTGIMEGVGKPELLLEPNANHHHYQLRPSQVAAIQKADIVIVTSLKAEAYAHKLLAQDRNRKTMLIEVLAIPGMTLIPSIDVDDQEDANNPKPVPDVHVWFDPMNAVAMTQYFTAELMKRMPQHQGKLEANATKLIARLQALNNEIEQSFKAFNKQDRHAAYMVYHNMLRYFEARYRIEGALALTSHPETQLKPEDVAEAEEAAKAGNLRCLFAESQFSAKPLQNLSDEYGIAIKPIDALGAAYKPGAELYFELLRDVSASVRECMEAGAENGQ